jgi:lipoyl(octanoyl) transferase
MTQALTGFYLGRRKYLPTFELMTELFTARQLNQVGDLVLLLEHAPVITLGRGAHNEHILAGSEQLRALGVDVVATGRGGDVTLHAPGQLIAYPIIDLKPDRCDVRKYVQTLTAVMNELIRPYGLDGGSIKDLIGLWLDQEQIDFYPGETQLKTPIKIGAIGVRISRWVTSHGFALNLSTNMELFRLIVPCGIKQHGVTSVQQLTGGSPNLRESARLALQHLNLHLGQDEPHFLDWEGEGFSQIKSRIHEYFSATQPLLSV